MTIIQRLKIFFCRCENHNWIATREDPINAQYFSGEYVEKQCSKCKQWSDRNAGKRFIRNLKEATKMGRIK